MLVLRSVACDTLTRSALLMGGGEACRTGAGGARKGAGRHCGILALTSVHFLCLYLSLRSQLVHLLLF